MPMDVSELKSKIKNMPRGGLVEKIFIMKIEDNKVIVSTFDNGGKASYL